MVLLQNLLQVTSTYSVAELEFESFIVGYLTLTLLLCHVPHKEDKVLYKVNNCKVPFGFKLVSEVFPPPDVGNLLTSVCPSMKKCLVFVQREHDLKYQDKERV